MKMKELSLDEIKEFELKILVEFDRYCRENGLKYSLAEGTLIGAVRHKGFIPWDDDIDVLMPREDFEKFLNSFQSNSYSIIKAPEDKYWPYSFIRLSDNGTIIKYDEFNDNNTYYSGGIWMDILPIDNFPDDDLKLKQTERKLFVLFKIYRAYRRNGFLHSSGIFNNAAWLFTKIVSFLVPPKLLIKKVEQLMKSYNKMDTKRSGTWACYWHSPWQYPSHCFADYDNIAFEGKTFMAIHDYDTYLKCQYGDYMKLPPIEKRIATHGYKAYRVSL